MQKFDYCTPTRLIFGQGAVEKLPEVMSRYGKKILMTYGGGSIKKIGLNIWVSIRIFLLIRMQLEKLFIIIRQATLFWFLPCVE